jgi:DNA-directed RNA polymerase specialized sigma54-like protein
MHIEIRDADLEARIQKQLQATGSRNVEEVLLRLLETQEEQDRWLLENRDAINLKIQRGIDQLDRGEGIPEDRLDTYLSDLKASAIARPTASLLRSPPRSSRTPA